MPTNSNSRKSKNPKRRSRVKKQTRNWLGLPTDLMLNILQRLDVADILKNAQKVCTAWREICKDPAMWRVIHINMSKHYMTEHYMTKHSRRRLVYEDMCKHAVDRSQGQLVDLTINGLCKPEILYYIANRSSQLRRLEIICSFDQVCGQWGEAFKKLPLLEELSLEKTNIFPEDIEAAGRYCPLLKTLKLNRTSSTFWDVIENNELALAIGKNLPRLSHLQLNGKCMKYDGLLAILDGCCHLESLDLHFCMCVDLTRLESGKRCSKEIKFSYNVCLDIILLKEHLLRACKKSLFFTFHRIGADDFFNF